MWFLSLFFSLSLKGYEIFLQNVLLPISPHHRCVGKFLSTVPLPKLFKDLPRVKLLLQMSGKGFAVYMHKSFCKYVQDVSCGWCKTNFWLHNYKNLDKVCNWFKLRIARLNPKNLNFWTPKIFNICQGSKRWDNCRCPALSWLLPNPVGQRKP